MSKIFPIELHCNDKDGGDADRSLRGTFMANKPADMIWYGYDAKIKSLTEIEFIVYAMHDPYRGYIGKEIKRFTVTDVDPTITRKFAWQKAKARGEERRKKELADKEAQIVDGFAKELMDLENLT